MSITTEDPKPAEENPAEPKRPEWLQEKFSTPEQQAEAYVDLEKKYTELSQKIAEDPPKEEPKGEDPKTAEGEPQGEDSGFQKYFDEYAKNGKLSNESYEELKAKGLEKERVDGYISYQNSQSEASAESVFGDMDTFNKATQWAASDWGQENVDKFNQAMDSGNAAAIEFALTGLKNAHSAAVGSPPQLIQGDPKKSTGIQKFESNEQLVEAMKDPRYAKDPAYRAEVVKRLAAS